MDYLLKHTGERSGAVHEKGLLGLALLAQGKMKEAETLAMAWNELPGEKQWTWYPSYQAHLPLPSITSRPVTSACSRPSRRTANASTSPRSIDPALYKDAHARRPAAGEELPQGRQRPRRAHRRLRHHDHHHPDGPAVMGTRRGLRHRNRGLQPRPRLRLRPHPHPRIRLHGLPLRHRCLHPGRPPGTLHHRPQGGRPTGHGRVRQAASPAAWQMPRPASTTAMATTCSPGAGHCSASSSPATTPPSARCSTTTRPSSTWPAPTTAPSSSNPAATRREKAYYMSPRIHPTAAMVLALGMGQPELRIQGKSE